MMTDNNKTEDAQAWINKGIALHDLGKCDKAIECFDKVIELDPRSTEGYEYKSAVLCNLKKYEEALECFDKIIELDPEDYESYYSKGLFFM